MKILKIYLKENLNKEALNYSIIFLNQSIK